MRERNFSKSIAAFVCLALLASTSCASSDRMGAIRTPASVSSEETDVTTLNGELEKVTKEIQEKRLSIRVPNLAELKSWMSDFLQYEISKPLRTELLKQLDAGLMPFHGSLAIHDTKLTFDYSAHFDDGEYVNNAQIPISDGLRAVSYQEIIDSYFGTRPNCSSPFKICDEPFRSPFPTLSAGRLAPSIPVRVTPFEVPLPQPMDFGGAELRQDALKVEILIRQDNLDDVASYFGTGWGSSNTKEKAKQLLGTSAQAWIGVQRLFGGWSANYVNTLIQFNSSGPSDVCHATAREFYYETPTPPGNSESSTEAIASLLIRHYCHLPEVAEPHFGDLMIVTGAHAARFILKDPSSQRWITLSSYSLSSTPYRFYWFDEDFSKRPFGRTPDFEQARSRTDIYRRCK